MAKDKDGLGSDYNGELTPLAVRRLNKEKDQLGRETKDLMEQGMYFHFDDSLNHKVVALIVGPDDTPYAGGFYLFEFTFPNTYPLKPPHVKFVTGDGRVRFNPNLYVTGKNEPGYEKEAGKDAELYSFMLRYENIAVAVMQLARVPEALKPLRPVMASIFVRRLPEYRKVLDDFDAKDGKTDKSPLYGFTTRYTPAEACKRLDVLREKLLEDSELKEGLAKDLEAASAHGSTPSSSKVEAAPEERSRPDEADSEPLAKRQCV